MMRLVRRGDIEKDQFIRPIALVAFRELHWVAHVTEPDEPGAFHHAPRLHIQADDHPSHEAHGTSCCTDTAPLVLNTLPVSASACRKQNPSALNAASTM